jgi:hypothetical protein
MVKPISLEGPKKDTEICEAGYTSIVLFIGASAGKVEISEKFELWWGE